MDQAPDEINEGKNNGSKENVERCALEAEYGN